MTTSLRAIPQNCARRIRHTRGKYNANHRRMRVWEETKVSQRQGLDLINPLYQRLSCLPFPLECVKPRPHGEQRAVRAPVRLTTGAGPHASPAEFDATPAAPHVIAPPVVHYRARAPGARARVGGLPATGRGEFCNFLPELELQVTTVTAGCTIDDRVNNNNMVRLV